MIKENYDIIKECINRGNSFHKRVYPYFFEFINFLNTENILYFLCGGTLLGCIRNGKQIPWDDDYDIYINTSEIKCLEKYSQDTSKIVTKKENIVYYLKLDKYSYLITKSKHRFYQVWGYNEGVGIVNKTMDIFNEKDSWYYNTKNFYSPNPIKYSFHDLMCNVSKNYDKDLRYFYGENYMNEYVVSNHKMETCYRDSDKNKRIIITKEEFNEIMKDIKDI